MGIWLGGFKTCSGRDLGAFRFSSSRKGWLQPHKHHKIATSQPAFASCSAALLSHGRHTAIVRPSAYRAFQERLGDGMSCSTSSPTPCGSEPLRQSGAGNQFRHHTSLGMTSGIRAWSWRDIPPEAHGGSRSYQVAGTSGTSAAISRASQRWRRRSPRLAGLHSSARNATAAPARLEAVFFPRPPRLSASARAKLPRLIEFEVKASILTNTAGPGGLFVVHGRALPDNPYDGHTYRDVIDRTETSIGCPIERPVSTRDIADATRKIPVVSSSPARSAASLVLSSASCAVAPPSSPSSDI